MLNKLNESKIFEKIYCLILCIISIICWNNSMYIGLIMILILSSITLFIFNDFKYVIPGVLFFIFSNNVELSPNSFPIPLIICSIIFLIVLIAFVIKNKINLKNVKSFAGILLLSISCIVPLLYNNCIPNDQGVLYFIYFSYLLYLIVYLLFATSLNKKSFDMLVSSFVYLAILIAFECILKVNFLHHEEPDTNILTFWYYLGWGLCNEAGIIMSMCLPFVFIEVIKSEKIVNIILSFVKLGIIVIGMILTTSRGTYIFGGIELVILLILASIYSKRRLTVIIIILSSIVLSLLFIQVKYGISGFINDISDYVFKLKLDNNNRLVLWEKSYNKFNEKIIFKIFGAGMVSEFYYAQSFVGMTNVFIVYHSTFFETLAAFGIVGLIFLGIHLYEKYKQLFKFERGIMLIMLVGYLFVDLYGLIDNSYSMYYYMIPLMIIMACLDNIDKNEFGYEIFGGAKMDLALLIKSYINKTNTSVKLDEDILKKSIEHNLQPILYPLYNDNRVMKYYVNSVLLNEKFNKIQHEITLLFNENKIRHLYVKGSVLNKIYDDDALRTRGDIDVYIDYNNLNKARDILLNNGYEKVEEILDCPHHVAFKKGNIEIEVHFSLFDMDGGKEIKIFKDPFIYSNILNEFEYKMDDTMHLLYWILHFKHHLRFGSGLRYILDFYYINKKQNIDYDLLHKYIDELKLNTLYNNLLNTYYFLTNEKIDNVNIIDIGFFINYLDESGIHGFSKEGNKSIGYNGDNKLKYALNRIFMIDKAYRMSLYPKCYNKWYLYVFILMHHLFYLLTNKMNKFIKLMFKRKTKEEKELYRRMGI